MVVLFEQANAERGNQAQAAETVRVKTAFLLQRGFELFGGD